MRPKQTKTKVWRARIGGGQNDALTAIAGAILQSQGNENEKLWARSERLSSG